MSVEAIAAESRVLICDDSMTNVMILSKLMENQGVQFVRAFTDPRKVLPFLQENDGNIDLLILDIEMPHLSGLQVLEAINTEYESVEQRPFAVLIITGVNDRTVRNTALVAGANDFLEKPFDPLEVTLRTRNLLCVQHALRLQKREASRLEKEVQKRTQELEVANNLLINLLGMAGELRDNETGQHVYRVGRYSRLLAETIGFPPEQCFMIERAAQLHDIGKIGIPDSILHKAGALDEKERAIMNSHTELGLKLLGDYSHDSQLLKMAATIAHTHHERWDGKGYPNQKSGENIPIEGRIVAIADVFDALTTARPYKDPWPLDKVEALLQREAGHHFDPHLIGIFFGIKDRFIQVLTDLPDLPADQQFTFSLG